MKASKLSLQAMSRLCFLCRLRQHILIHSNAPFVEKPDGHRPVSLPGILLLRGCLVTRFSGGNWIPGFSVYK